MGKFLVEKGGPVKARLEMYRSFFQSVLLYGREIWVVTYVMMKVLEVCYCSVIGVGLGGSGAGVNRAMDDELLHV